ncbi:MULTISPECIES: DUF4440 domain-containing protein [Kocuria]|uniref:DUF4440 domain-containing protein n=1 Tax=Kocuria subflava TaxID=1736139 RepID=A0A846TP14_9MICC|nr:MULTISPECIES: DUF4440 domain-containing protein [Kocuria]NKE10163.1 DUF4440 domain-containing protein [Kocuria subflava]
MDKLTLATLVELEEKGWRSLCNGTGGSFYGDLMTEGALMVLVNGVVMNREAVVASLNDAPAWDRYEINDAQVVSVGVDSSAIVYRAVAHRGDEAPFEALMSSTYVLENGTPRLVLYQQTTTTH